MLRNPSLCVLAACRLIKTTPLFTRGGNRGRGVNAVYRIPTPTIYRIDTGQTGYTRRSRSSSSRIALEPERGEAFNRGYPLIPTFVRARFVVIS